MRTLILSAAMLAAVLPAPVARSTTPSLASLRRATGMDQLDATAVVSMRGSSRFMGSDGRYTLAFAADGRCREVIAGPISQRIDFDGTTVREIDWNGIHRDLVLNERDETLLRMWLLTGLWTREPAGLIVLPGDDESTYTVYLREGGLAATVTVDPETSLPQRFTYARGAVELDVALSDYRRAAGVTVPHHIEITGSDGDHQTYEIEDLVAQDGPGFPAAAEMPNPTATFDPAADAVLELKTAPTQHLMTPVRINGKDAGWFIFDSGAGANIISTPVAKEFGLEMVGSTPVMGVAGPVEGEVFEASSMTVGPLSVASPIMIGVDLSPFEPVFGVKLGGIIGYDVLARAVVVYDFNGPHIELHDPATFELGGGKWQDLYLNDRTSHAEMTFEGHRGIFLIDTGAANSSVGIYAPAVAALDLLSGRKTEVTQVSGGGGTLEAQGGTLQWIELAGRRFDDVDASFATESRGVFADTYVDGSVGGKVLGHFTLVFDYSHQRIAFVPR